MALAWVKKTERDHYDRTVGIRWKLMDGDREAAAVLAGRTDHRIRGPYYWEVVVVMDGQEVSSRSAPLSWTEATQLIKRYKKMLTDRLRGS